MPSLARVLGEHVTGILTVGLPLMPGKAEGTLMYSIEHHLHAFCFSVHISSQIFAFNFWYLKLLVGWLVFFIVLRIRKEQFTIVLWLKELKF